MGTFRLLPHSGRRRKRCATGMFADRKEQDLAPRAEREAAALFAAGMLRPGGAQSLLQVQGGSGVQFLLRRPPAGTRRKRILPVPPCGQNLRTGPSS